MEVEPRAKRPGVLICVAISAWPSERTVDSYLPVVDGRCGSTTLGADTDAMMALLGDSYAVDDDRCIRSGYLIRNGRP